jgi:hypothetical protein
MNVRLVLALSLLGLIVGVGSIFGLIPTGWETGVWAVIALVCAGVLAARAPGKLFLHGFLTGFIAGVLSTLCQALFVNQYMAHNARAADVLATHPAGLSPAVFVVLAAPIWAVLLGLVIGLLAWIGGRFARPKPAA